MRELTMVILTQSMDIIKWIDVLPLIIR
jgi:hypothetical protein